MVILVVFYTLMGGNPIDVIKQTQLTNPEVISTYHETPEDKELIQFIIQMEAHGYVYRIVLPMEHRHRDKGGSRKGIIPAV